MRLHFVDLLVESAGVRAAGVGTSKLMKLDRGAYHAT